MSVCWTIIIMETYRVQQFEKPKALLDPENSPIYMLSLLSIKNWLFFCVQTSSYLDVGKILTSLGCLPSLDLGCLRLFFNNFDYLRPCQRLWEVYFSNYSWLDFVSYSTFCRCRDFRHRSGQIRKKMAIYSQQCIPGFTGIIRRTLSDL
jgi:hypothetical protein